MIILSLYSCSTPKKEFQIKTKKIAAFLEGETSATESLRKNKGLAI